MMKSLILDKLCCCCATESLLLKNSIGLFPCVITSSIYFGDAKVKKNQIFGVINTGYDQISAITAFS